MNAGLLLYIMYFPVYNKEGDYNNFTSARSWPLLTLGIWDAQFFSPSHTRSGRFFVVFLFFFNVIG